MKRPLQVGGPFALKAEQVTVEFQRAVESRDVQMHVSDSHARVDDETCSPMLLTPRATAVFLPAWLLRALDQLPAQGIVTEFTVYSLCPYNIDDGSEERMIASPHATFSLAETRELMTPQQIRAVRGFLEHVRDYAPNAAWLHRFIEPALATTWAL